MTDVVDAATRSRWMSGIRSKDTKPEFAVRSYLHAQGMRYRLHVKSLPGTPDLVFAKYRCCLFVHGCFWHQHEGCRLAAMPSTRPSFWRQKLAGNVARDRLANERLMEAGWRVVEIWECGVRRGDIRALTWLPQAITHSMKRHISWPLTSAQRADEHRNKRQR